ncbi:hypothetical protein Pcinc_032970 [Petrolisthes cinctipes]|uniref:Condensation domain-containing protein n=1 Tax=Petrolisthes cinctipes TaxID=88211 RepID=A0AAE1ET07_PETCI|nr:hypothetical protein Pcinc_032970 [Petrolisthes cinctipes]
MGQKRRSKGASVGGGGGDGGGGGGGLEDGGSMEGYTNVLHSSTSLAPSTFTHNKDDVSTTTTNAFHKSLTPRSSFDSVVSNRSSVSSSSQEDSNVSDLGSVSSGQEDLVESSDRSSVSSGQEDSAFDHKDDCSDSAFEQESCHSQTEDCAFDHDALEFDTNGPFEGGKYTTGKMMAAETKKEEEEEGATSVRDFHDGPSTSSDWGRSEGPLLSSDLLLPDHKTNSYVDFNQKTLQTCYAFGSCTSYFDNSSDLNSNTNGTEDQVAGPYTTPLNRRIAMQLESSNKPDTSPRDSVHYMGEWVRPLGKFEMLMATGGFYSTLNTIQALRISSTQPIRPDAVRYAITTLARRTELMQVGVVRRGLWWWFRRMDSLTVPFRVEDTQDGDVMPIYYYLLHKAYNMSRGPLWRARMVTQPQTSDGVHRAVLMFTIHHCITDAFTNMILCRETLKILNASMTGQVFIPELRPLSPAIGDQLVSSSDLLYAAKFAFYKFYSSTVGNFNKYVYFKGAFPQPVTTNANTRVLYDEMTEDATSRLLKRCKSSGATVHSTIMTLAKLAMITVANERSGGLHDNATIRVLNCVNMRRYFPEAYQDAVGCHISIEEQEIEVDILDVTSPERLWSLVKRVHQSLHKSLKDGQPYKNLPGLVPCSVLIPLNYALTTLNQPCLNDSHIISTNMGDLRDLLPEQCGKGPVRITHLLRCVSDQYTGHPYTLIFHTFLGRFSFCLEHYTNKTDPDLASQFFTVLSNYISDVASHGAIRTGEVDRSHDFHKDKF